jgi:hypothetical protein
MIIDFCQREFDIKIGVERIVIFETQFKNFEKKEILK